MKWLQNAVLGTYQNIKQKIAQNCQNVQLSHSKWPMLMAPARPTLAPGKRCLVGRLFFYPGVEDEGRKEGMLRCAPRSILQ